MATSKANAHASSPKERIEQMAQEAKAHAADYSKEQWERLARNFFAAGIELMEAKAQLMLSQAAKGQGQQCQDVRTHGDHEASAQAAAKSKKHTTKNE